MPSKKSKPIKTQKGQDLAEMTEDQAREHLEKLRWPNGLCCIECGSVNAYKLNGESTRPGLIKCRDCKSQFTVTVGTIFEDSHLPLAKWVKAFHLMASSKKGISALQLMRNLGLGSYRTAWHLAHRIRYAMSNPTQGILKGTVEVDETYVGGKPRNRNNGDLTSRRGRGTKKTPVMALVQRNGNVISRPVERCDAATLRGAIHTHVAKESTIVTDEFRSYRGIGEHFDGGHKVINHSLGQYVNGNIYTNTAESYFALIKRGHYGVFHQISKKHLHRYCDEFVFRWNGREMTDVQRRTLALMQTEGKRLMYRQPVGEA
jgi:transposase-like protein